ncbi:MAG: hypothetical protein AAB857_03235 [Patescibacteria group bacterium]
MNREMPPSVLPKQAVDVSSTDEKENALNQYEESKKREKMLTELLQWMGESIVHGLGEKMTVADEREELVDATRNGWGLEALIAELDTHDQGELLRDAYQRVLDSRDAAEFAGRTPLEQRKLERKAENKKKDEILEVLQFSMERVEPDMTVGDYKEKLRKDSEEYLSSRPMLREDGTPQYNSSNKEARDMLGNRLLQMIEELGDAKDEEKVGEALEGLKVKRETLSVAHETEK